MIFNNRVAVVTGSTQGIGLAIAKRLAKEGVKVVVTSRNADKVNEAVAEIKNDGGEAFGLKCNVTNREEVKALGEKVIEKYGSIDILVNNAGITRDSSFKKMTDEQWDEVIDSDLKSVFIVTQELSKYMELNKYGRIISLSSVVGLSGNFGQANYSAAKAGIIGLTKTLSMELGKKGITVNAIAPGFIETAMTQEIPEKIRNEIIASIPVGRPGEPEDIAAATAFLASEEAGFVSGVTLSINGAMYRS
ncbi:3-oxoacyl-[acyl-carrier-protein] reductase [Sedimentibacter hydroxybenzoicus DSM 7310]|uniref:3-oxoacyl-[acyl-carrier-protein] reductase n=1 Tax=Sedimentibacter hydroxybenzoicus DSM 7310 TaxID=1123245 RepID=A0A974GWP4_SEDHY|nr:3-oxoacyl-[acyl-carrier-protein] reductase [Sedimentibacter hydroxybenzoicus]NYB74709.1 3-oxoacyl-[acyl-carrier-protein] reductase [Sedimentibacter hydroxybenzoicus DSM 7310]